MKSFWKVLQSFDGKNFLDIGNYAVLVLNRPISVPYAYMVNLWNEATFCATADGGTDRWYDFLSTLQNESQIKRIHPNLVSGDFDSVRPETLRKCKENGVTVIHTPDQDKTDFTKSLEEILKQKKGEIDSVVAVVENSGRLDHIMTNLSTLYTFSNPVSLYLLGSGSLTWLLKAGSHEILVPQSLVQRQKTCGLIPLGAPCVATTTGLKWNLNKDRMEFGGLISSCNTYDISCNGVVTVETDSPILWTMCLGFDKE